MIFLSSVQDKCKEEQSRDLALQTKYICCGLSLLSWSWWKNRTSSAFVLLFISPDISSNISFTMSKQCIMIFLFQMLQIAYVSIFQWCQNRKISPHKIGILVCCKNISMFTFMIIFRHIVWHGMHCCRKMFWRWIYAETMYVHDLADHGEVDRVAKSCWQQGKSQPDRPISWADQHSRQKVSMQIYSLVSKVAKEN